MYVTYLCMFYYTYLYKVYVVYLNMKVNVTTTLDLELRQLLDRNFIPASKALEFGAKFLLAENDFMDYPENSLSEKIPKIMAELQNAQQMIEDMRSKGIKPINKEEIIKEVEEEVKKVLGDVPKSESLTKSKENDNVNR